MADYRKRGRNWYYRFIDATGRRVMRKGCPDRRATEELARAAESEAAKVRAGLIDPKALALIGHAARPLAEHLDVWQADMEAKGDTLNHARLFADRARRLVPDHGLDHGVERLRALLLAGAVELERRRARAGLAAD